MKLPVHFYKPLAIGAPQPLRELPVRPERMIHFFPPHIDKIRAKAPETARQCDVMCGNLEDAIPIEAKDAARAGFIDLLAAHDFGAVSYTHLDVYKRQAHRSTKPRSRPPDGVRGTRRAAGRAP